MGIRAQAQIDAGKILENVLGARWSMTITDPSGTSASLYGFSADISQVIDPDTGQVVSGRLASIAVRIQNLTDNGLGLPQGIENGASRAWKVEFDDINGNPFTFKVQKTNPDRTIGIVVCYLELMKTA